MEAIKITNLTKSYGKSRGIKNVNLEIKEGEIYGFIGPNGAGKSTTIKTLLNFIFPTSGSAKILGKDIVSESKLIKEFTSYVPSEVRYYSDVKVKDILNYAASFFDYYDDQYLNELCSELEVELDKKIEELSLGNKKKVAIVQALLSNPKIVILDEPTNGLDPLIQQKLFNILLKEKAKGKTIFLSSHNLSEIEKFCDRVAVIKEGEIIDILDLNKMNRDLGKRIILRSNDINIKEIEKISESFKYIDEEIEFIYKGNINELISLLSKYNLDKLLIEDVKLEEAFLNYYEGENK
ncbi:ABC transporter ATP-binding protein [Clostridium tertium]|jgi:ABC-2 type transport system ATP-binding protein|uniref:ABC transporter ATP-binding protein n=1 Tax=Clostridium TaxID=1485 RepID=UPI001D517D50|nr:MULTISPECIES: ABC transporter ATP-binding protein [Clostridium]MBS5307932.1 ABC transporter ATP-binding protein [Clostridium sp.]MBS6501349.1 ABC transporter ATP-binding protein [Clostridium sp.]MDB1921329.1 ABC transporter ATP-binding protein [Clostridium tertium]MDB1924574.1 ABC transporter ATP-binding protein [Clostridium tertium]MDB1928104.1 ABC transporter ATP-binding protein [Clostridium tertium]